MAERTPAIPWSDVWTVFRGDLRMQLRDPVALVVMILLPVLLVPALLIGLGAAQASQQAALVLTEVTVDGPAALEEWLVPEDKVQLRPGSWTDAQAPAQALVRMPEPHPEGLNPGRAMVEYRGDSELGREAGRRMDTVLHRAAEREQGQRWQALGVPISPDELLQVESVDHASLSAQRGHRLGMFVPALLVFLMASAALYPALDLFAGEKERGTLESLLTTRVDRRAVVVARFGVISLTGAATGWLAMLSLAITSRLDWVPLPGEDLGAGGLPTTALVFGAVVVLPLAAQIAAVNVIASAYAPDFRTGQMLAMPLLLGLTAPAGAAMLPSMELSPLLALLPVANTGLALRGALSGQLGLGLGTLSLLAACLHAALAVRLASHWMGRETVLVGGGSDQQRHRQGRYLPEALALFLLALVLFWFLGQVLTQIDLVGGLVITQVLGFAAIGVGAVVWLGAPLQQTLQLRRPSARNLGLAVVAGLSAHGLAELVFVAGQALVPTPQGYLEAMGESLQLDLGLPMLILVLAVLPGVCEELLFRGAIQGLARNSLGPWARCLLVGLLFGLLHTELARIGPTAALGIVFALAAWRSGALWIPILMHVLHNGLLVAGSELGWMSSAPETGWTSVGLAALCLVCVAAMGPVRTAARDRLGPRRSG